MSRYNKYIGRPESFNARYFSHKVNESDELKVMVRNFKYEGYVGYYRLFECVAKANLYRIELKNKTQQQIFLMNMDVSQEVIDFLIKLLIETGKMNSEQWEKNQTIYLDEFVKQFKYLWYKRNKTIPDANGKYHHYVGGNTQKIKANKLSDVEKGNNIIQYNKIKENRIQNNKVKEESKDDNPLSLHEYENLFPKKDLTFLKKYLKNSMAKHSKAMDICENEIYSKKIIFKKTGTGYNKAWCSKCNKREFPDDFQLKRGSECCSVSYTNEPKNV